jgi:hypothetical protein
MVKHGKQRATRGVKHGKQRATTGEKLPLDAINSSSLKHVKADHGVVVHDHRVVGLDEPHPTHISSKVEHMVDPRGHLEAVVHDPQVNEMELVAEHLLSHVLVLLPVRGDDVVALALEAPRNVGGDEPAGARDGDPQLLKWPVGLLLQLRVRVLLVERHSAQAKGQDLRCKTTQIESTMTSYSSWAMSTNPQSL